jgi:sulfur-oxidizing protein SoxX
MGRGAAALLCIAAAAGEAAAGTAADASMEAGTGTALAAPVRIVDDGIAEILPGAVAGDPERGRAIVADRQAGLCLLCHSAPIAEVRFQGDLATNLAGAGTRLTPAQLRLRIVDASRLNPKTIMPSYFKVQGFNRVAAAYQGKAILGAQQIEDVVAYLQTLRSSPQSPPPGQPQ